MCSLNQIGESTGLWHKLEIIQIFDNICCRTSQSTGIMGTGSEWNYLLHVKFSTDCWANKYGRYVELQANEGRAKTAQIHIHKIPTYIATHTPAITYTHTLSGLPAKCNGSHPNNYNCKYTCVCVGGCLCVNGCVYAIIYTNCVCIRVCVCVCVGHCALADQTILSLWLLFFCHKYLLDIWARAKLKANLWREGCAEWEGRQSCQANLSAVLWKFNTIPCGAAHMRLIHIKLNDANPNACSLWNGGQAIKGNILIPHLYRGELTQIDIKVCNLYLRYSNIFKLIELLCFGQVWVVGNGRD